jgi:hypothetical protein
MARGWESKSVEAQIESAEERTSRRLSRRVEPSASEIELSRKRENLQLSRTRVRHELETSKNPRYLVLLNRELAVLDEKLRDLS